MNTASPPGQRMHAWQDRAEWALVPIGALAFFIMPHEIGLADAEARFVTLDRLISGGPLDLRYSIVQPIFAIPFYLVGLITGSVYRTVVLFNTSVFIGGLVAIGWLLYRRIPPVLLRRILLLLLAASMFGANLRLFMGEVLTAVLVGVGLLCVVVERPFAGHLLLLLGVINTPATVPALFLGLLALARRQRLWRAIWPTALAALLILLEFYLRRGSPWMSGYENDHGEVTVLPYSGQPGFSLPLFIGLPAIVFSFGKGLAFFIPGLWVVWKSPTTATPDVLARFQRSAIWFVLGMLLVYGKWWAWQGAFFWGPRFFLFACFPASIALAQHLSDRAATDAMKAFVLALLAWSVWVAVNGIIVGLGVKDICSQNWSPLDFLCWYSVEFSPLFHPFIEFPTIGRRAAVVGAYCVVVGAVLAAPVVMDLIRSGRARLQVSLQPAARE